MDFSLKRLVLSVALLLLAGATTAFAQSVAERVQARYKTITTMRAEYTQTLVHKESGSREQRSGILSFAKPLLVRMEAKAPSPELLLVAKDAIWNVFPEEEMAYKYSLSLAQDSRSIVQVMTGQASLDKDFHVENQKEEDSLLVLDLYPKEPTQAMVEVRLWIDPKTDLIKKLRVFDFYGNENEMAFSKQEMNADIPASLFTYTPPKGFMVEDRTRDTAATPGNL
jgi:outer membrane lipoprotein carrier protein